MRGTLGSFVDLDLPAERQLRVSGPGLRVGPSLQLTPSGLSDLDGGRQVGQRETGLLQGLLLLIPGMERAQSDQVVLTAAVLVEVREDLLYGLEDLRLISQELEAAPLHP